MSINKNPKALGDRLRIAREHARLSQEDLEKRSGVSQKTISKIERGDQSKSSRIVQLARACGVRPDWLGANDGPMLETPGAREAEPPQYILGADALELARAWQDLPEDRREHYRAAIALESAIHAMIGSRAMLSRADELLSAYRERLERLLGSRRKP